MDKSEIIKSDMKNEEIDNTDSKFSINKEIINNKTDNSIQVIEQNAQVVRF